MLAFGESLLPFWVKQATDPTDCQSKTWTTRDDVAQRFAGCGCQPLCPVRHLGIVMQWLPDSVLAQTVSRSRPARNQGGRGVIQAPARPTSLSRGNFAVLDR